MPEHNNQPLDSTNSESVQPTSTRRAFLGGLGAVALAAGLPRPLLAGQDTFKRSHDEVARLLKPLLETSDPALFDFAVSVYEHAIFGRMQPAEPPIKHPWLIPGGPYVGQWVWDTTFLTDLVAILPGQDEFIRGIYQNYWDAQGRLDTVKPAYRRGMVPNFIAPDSGTKVAAFIVLGLTFVTTGTIWCLVLAVAAGKLRRFFARHPRRWAAVSRASGGLFVLLGLRLAMTRQ